LAPMLSLRARRAAGHKGDAKAPLYGDCGAAAGGTRYPAVLILRLPCFARGGDAAKGKEALPTPVLSRAGAHRAAEPISKVRPDAEEILRLVLARLDDMKAEDTVTIDLTGKSTIADTMVVTSG